MELRRELVFGVMAGAVIVGLGACAAGGGGTTAGAAGGSASAGSAGATQQAVSLQGGGVPRFVVDPTWPEPLQYPFILGSVTGVAVGGNGNIFIVTRQDRFTQGTEIGATLDPPGGECCVPSPAVIEYDTAGVPVRQWGGPGSGYDWFRRPHGIAVDPQGNVWVGGSGTPPPPPAAPAAAGAAAGGGGRGGAAAGGGRGGAAAGGAAAGGGRGGAAAGGAAAGGGGRGGGGGGPVPGPDTHILKFSRYGTHLQTIGRVNAPLNNSSNNSFGGPARIDFDVAANEAYVADGYFHRRVVVLDMTSGAVKRFWGAYGEPPSNDDPGPYVPGATPSRHFRTVTCAVPSNDGFVYVCDRGNNRIQVFRKNGTFVREMIIAPNTRGAVTAGLSKDRGSVWDIALSHDPAQRFMYVADGMNERVYVIERSNLQLRTSFGIGGRYPSHFLAVGSIAVDARGNIYTGEDEEGKRVQKFTFTGMGSVPANQGAVWPTRP